jgi:chaperonin GroEL
MNKIVKFDHEVRDEIKKGIEILADAVKTTMGPSGKTVLIERVNQHPIITKDGVTVAKAINLSAQFQNLGVQVVKEAASRSADEAGDGTTTATVLAQAMYERGLRYISAGVDSVILRKGMERALEEVTNNLKKMAIPIETDQQVKDIALVSCNNEIQTAELISAAIKKVGIEGSIIVEEAKGYSSDLKIVEGFQIDRGYMSPYFVNDEEKMCVAYENCYVLIFNKKLDSIKEIIKPLELCLEESKPLLIVANDIDNEALQGLVLNKTKGNLKVCAIKSPGFGNARHDMLSDIAAITGGKIIDQTHSVDDIDESFLGKSKKILVSRLSTLFVAFDDRKEKVDSRLDLIRTRLDERGLEPNEVEVLNYRLNRMSGGIAVLRIGASTEAEMIERRDRVDDALCATKAALQEGILPGGGISLIRASYNIKSETPDFMAGYEIIRHSCLIPLKQIVSNCGKSPDLVIEKVLENKSISFGYDSRSDIYGDMFELGIIDPLKVVRCALQNSASAASLLLTSDCGLVNEKK